ncbi:transcription elongation regulator 1-like protein [Manis pentadactyla]|uniref:transcription elongation regulator 1-like protein n=1 Tax=Manis pentadactyla TaxID=143292 RepID=UPI00255D12E6|nr:transcription elongation regulator 1-like protein [Manis pentadactyla]
MLVGARFQRRRRQPQPRRRQPLLWPMNADPPPPPWVWMVPGPAGLLRLGAGVAPPPVLLAAAQPPAAPLFPGPPGWPAPGEPLLPWAPPPSAPDHAAAAHHHRVLSGQWLFGGHSPPLGLCSPSTVELVPIFPQVCPSALLPPVGKSWIDKRIPTCKIFLNNSFALDSTWIYPEESRLFHGHEKPHVLANQVAMSLSRPAPASRPLPTVVLAPQPVPGGRHNSLKPVSGSPAFAIAAAAAAVVSVDPERLGGPSPSSVQPCHFLTLAPIKLPLWTTSFPDKSRERSRAPCPPSLMLHTERKSPAGAGEDKDPPSILVAGESSATKGNRPVASTPVPGSPWCVVWTGDDRVFFFNPTMQLSVWEKPMDLKNRGDLNRILEDPPHKRKLQASPRTELSDGSSSEDGREDQTMKTKRNRMEGRTSPEPEEAEREDQGAKPLPPQILLPLEERVTHFRDMLLERGVSAFSTWEKELHKIVFDPRYLLLNSEERKQIFEQFVKTRIKEEYKERRSKLLLAKEEFRKLLEESKVSPRTTFKEFADKYGQDQRFRLVQKRKDQEHFFNQFILILKKRDKENRIRLRKMR